MTSYFAWLDHSESDRRRMLDVIDLFREQETRDELGIGTIRDAFADLLFPGTSTIQTRLRYFLFVPWVYRALEAKRVSAREIAQRARRDEIALTNALAAAGEREGVIGIEAREKLKRLPSNVYWQGLGVWGIRHLSASQEQYHRAFDRLAGAGPRELRDDDGVRVEGGAPVSWDRRLPPPPPWFPSGATFAVSKAEAEYLRDRILARCPGTMLAWLADQARPWEPVSRPWQHPELGAFPESVREQLLHARNFSEVMHGAPLLYNLMLAELAQNQERVAQYREDLREWASSLAARERDLTSWDERRFWAIARRQGGRIGPMAEGFVSRWLGIVRGLRWPPAVADLPVARDLVANRERALKKALSRLDNRRALERWSGAAGTEQLSFRWGKSQALVRDLVDGLRRSEGHA